MCRCNGKLEPNKLMLKLLSPMHLGIPTLHRRAYKCALRKGGSRRVSVFLITRSAINASEAASPLISNGCIPTNMIYYSITPSGLISKDGWIGSARVCFSTSGGQYDAVYGHRIAAVWHFHPHPRRGPCQSRSPTVWTQTEHNSFLQITSHHACIAKCDR
jgi:hypothetical protein